MNSNPNQPEESAAERRAGAILRIDLEALAENYRILAGPEQTGTGSASRQIHLFGGGNHWQGTDVFELFEQLMDSGPRNMSPDHAFYLGYELCKATIANQLGKNYEQDEPLRWGHLTVDEIRHRRLQRRRKHQQ